jgi:signal transduction histidine kinase
MTTTSNQVRWPTIGVLAGWQYYWTPTPLNYLNPVYRGIRQATVPLAGQRDLERLHANAQHLSRLISDVLDLASSDAGRLRLSYQYVDLGQALQVVAGTGRQLATDKGLRWSADLPESGPWVWGDRTRLTQVAYNLVSNAIKFTSRGEVGLALECAAGSVTVSVRDTGLGIPPDEQPVIFDEFRRSERSIQRGYGGLGLGLSICKRLIELHGGSIGVESAGQEDAGSVFYFTLPVVEPPLAQVARSHGAARVEAGVLVLTTSPSTS